MAAAAAAAAAAVLSILMMEAMHFSETLLCIPLTSRRHISLPPYPKFISREYVRDNGCDLDVVNTHTHVAYTNRRLAPVLPPNSSSSLVKSVSPKAKAVRCPHTRHPSYRQHFGYQKSSALESPCLTTAHFGCVVIIFL